MQEPYSLALHISPLPNHHTQTQFMLLVVQLLSHVQLYATPWTAVCQASLFFTISWTLFKCMSIELGMLANHFVLSHPLLLLPSTFPSIRVFSNESVLHFSGQSTGVSSSASVLPMNTQARFPLGLTGTPCCPRDSQESSPTPQFKSINSLVLSLLHSPILTSIHDHRKTHSLD